MTSKIIGPDEQNTHWEGSLFSSSDQVRYEYLAMNHKCNMNCWKRCNVYAMGSKIYIVGIQEETMHYKILLG